MTGRVESATDLVDLRDVELAQMLLDSIARRDEALRRLLMLAAVPPRVDAGLLARVAETMLDPSDFERGYDRLRALSYVKESLDGSFTLHDDLRLPLLELWESHGLDGATLADVRDVVLTVWDERYDEARRAEGALDVVAGVVRSAEPSRYAAAYRGIKRLTDHALVHGTVAAVAADAEAARSSVQRRLREHSARREYAQCDLIARAFAGAVTAVPNPEQRSRLLAWAAYYRSETAADLEDWEAADRWLDEAEPEAASDPVFALWIATQRLRVLTNQNRLVEAQRAAEALVELNDETHADRWNEHVAHRHLAGIHTKRWRPEETAASLRRAIDSALGVDNVEAALDARLAFAAEVEDQGAAAAELLHAVVSARLEDFDVTVNATCARISLMVLGWRSPRLASLLSQQVRQMTRGEGPHAVIDLYAAQASVYDQAGLAVRASQAIDEAISYATDLAPERLPQLSATRAALASEVGHAEAAAEQNLAVLANPVAHEDRWLRAQCLTNAALNLLEVSEAKRALELAEEARPLFEEMGNEGAAAYTWMVQAKAHRIQGRVDDAASALARVDEKLPVSYAAALEVDRMRLAAARGDRTGAAEAGARAFAVSRMSTDRRSTLTYGAEAVQALGRANRFEEAARIAREVAALADEITAYADWRPTDATIAADAHAAEAVRIWKAGIGHPLLRLRSAREHCGQALQLDPDVWWIHLEAALIEFAAGDRSTGQRELNLASSLVSDDVILRDALERVRPRLG